jgi:hypothetical protein
VEINRLARKEVFLTVYAVRASGIRVDLTEVDIVAMPIYRKPILATTWSTLPLIDDETSFFVAGPDADEPGDVVVSRRGIDLWIRVHDGSETDLAFVERLTLD